MTKTLCCEILEYTNGENNIYFNCNVKTCNQRIELCVNNMNSVMNLYLDKNILTSLLSNVKCNIDKDKYKIVGAIIVSKYIYIFIQTGYKTKHNTLCTVHGTMDMEKKEIINKTLQLQSFYNIYKTGRSEHISREHSIKLKIEQVTYNKFNDMFIVLFNSCDRTFIGKIDNLEAIFSIGTYLNLVYSHQCHLFIIDHKPICIIPLTKNTYKLSVYDQYIKCNKTFTCCF